MKIFMTPLDVLLFRSSRPFYKGDDNIAEFGYISSLIFAGALKSKILLEFNPEPPNKWWNSPNFKQLIEEIGGPFSEGKMKILGAFFASKNKKEELFTAPFDIVKDERDRSKNILLKPKEFLNLGEYYPLFSETSYYTKNISGFLPKHEFLCYLNGEVPQRIVKSSKIYAYERRIGIEIETKKNLKTIKEGMLYAAEFLRVKDDYGFSVWIENADSLQNGGLIKLGGEGRYAIYNSLEEEIYLNFSNLIKKINEEQRLKLYLSTPAIFLKNKNINWWKPNLKKIEETLKITDLRLLSAAIGKPILLGGWDLALKKQKPLRYVVRDGAVYFFKFRGKIKNIKIPFSISDLNSNEGLGTVFIGRW